jgi:predicted nucleotidyltransferase
MNILNQTYKELAIPYFKEAFEIIDAIMKEHKIPYYLIGVSAIALKLLGKGIKPSRGTKDIDFAIMISSLEDFETISESLQEKGFEKVEAPWTFYSKALKVAIDILPFGQIEQHDTVWFNERYSDLHVLGFKEVLENPDKILIEDKIANIPPLAGMILLKLVAWSDRPEERDNDLSDILRIIEHYFELESNQIFDDYYMIFPEGEEEFDELQISAEVLGMKAREYLKKSRSLEERILGLLKANLDSTLESKIAKEWAQKKDWEFEKAFKILKAFEKGISRVN